MPPLLSLVESFIAGLRGEVQGYAKNVREEYFGYCAMLANGESPDSEAMKACLEALSKGPEDLKADVERMAKRLEAADTLAECEEATAAADIARAELQRLKGDLDAAQALFDEASWPLIETINRSNGLDSRAIDARTLLMQTAGADAMEENRQATAALNVARRHAENLRAAIASQECLADNAEVEAAGANVPPKVDAALAKAASHRKRAAELTKQLAAADAALAKAEADSLEAGEAFLIP